MQVMKKFLFCNERGGKLRKVLVFLTGEKSFLQSNLTQIPWLCFDRVLFTPIQSWLIVSSSCTAIENLQWNYRYMLPACGFTELFCYMGLSSKDVLCPILSDLSIVLQLSHSVGPIFVSLLMYLLLPKNRMTFRDTIRFVFLFV